MTSTLAPAATRSSFRIDINGIRAWAVLAVVLYHFGISGFSGGFVGVDIFFVISGFLMTGIVISALEAQRFSLWHFYLARARRIIPALFLLCVVLLILGWFYLPTPDYHLLGRHIIYAITFLSNLKFRKEDGYFDAASHEKWLLHTWSLSVEWQFYLLLPIALLFIWRWWSKAGVKVALILTFTLSFIWSVYLTERTPAAAFYLLPSRAWEMLAGSLVWWFTVQSKPSYAQAIFLETIGFGLIVMSITILDSTSAWPGGLALLPVVGTMLLLAANRHNSLITANIFAQWLGSRSYSIYLWHWPIVVILNYVNMQDSTKWTGTGLLATLLIGETSYRLVEAPARRYLAQLKPRADFAIIGTATVLLVIAAGFIRHQSIADRIPAHWEQVSRESNNVKPNRDHCFSASGTQSPSCVYGGENIRAIVLGDSHADALTTAVQSALPNKSDGVIDWSYVSCPTISGVHLIPEAAPSTQHCDAFNDWAIKKLSSFDAKIPVIIINRTSVYAFGQHNGDPLLKKRPLIYFDKKYATPAPEFLAEFKEKLINTACLIAKRQPTYLVQPIPEMPIDVPKFMARRAVFGFGEVGISISQMEYQKRHTFVREAQYEAAKRCGVKLLDPAPYLVRDGRYWGSQNGWPLYYDDDHLSEFGNKLLTPMFQQVFAVPSKLGT
ncbi:acyltransferase family protein [Chitinimonas sp. PSY-7]|uniref:SGNH hydrolase domain-containing protein n=1 Tax=Chitinimonas sp. PSY-7 TaxID=3459088 RepID=UPI0040402628